MSKSSIQYWRNRESDKLKKGLKDSHLVNKYIKNEYLKASEEIQSKIAKLYMKYAKDNNLTYYEASKHLNSNEFKAWKMSLKDYINVIEKVGDKELLLELNTLAMKSRISRLEEMLYQINMEIDKATLMQHRKLTELLENTYRDNYYKTIFDIQKFKGIGSSFAFVDKDTIKDILSYPWSGLDYSSRIWSNRKKIKESIKQELTQMIIQGKGNKEVAKNIAKKMNTNYNNAIRLVDTEHSYIIGKATMDGYEESGVGKYEFLATLDMTTSQICADMDGKVFKTTEAVVGANYPPLHCNCRSTTVPYFDDMDSVRTTREQDGKTYEVPSSMKYEEWHRKYIKE